MPEVCSLQPDDTTKNDIKVRAGRKRIARFPSIGEDNLPSFRRTSAKFTKLKGEKSAKAPREKLEAPKATKGTRKTGVAKSSSAEKGQEQAPQSSSKMATRSKASQSAQ